jgi:phosphoenolpyruvate carboxykinase (ATP)
MHPYLEQLSKVHLRQLTAQELIQVVESKHEEHINQQKFIVVNNHPYTGRSPKDKFFVENAGISHLNKNELNRTISQQAFDECLQVAMDYMDQRDCFETRCHAGADLHYKLELRVITEFAWQNLFVQQAFYPSLGHSMEDVTIIALPGLKFDPSIHPTRSEVFIGLDLEQGILLIAGTKYAGEIKKAVFSYLNYILPIKEIFPMHCAASTMGEKVGLFFGLSGTGKTTLSLDANLTLVGDDEHAWTPDGIFNMENCSYAKVNGIDAEHDPIMWHALKPYTVVENSVVSDAINFKDMSVSENIRATLSLTSIDQYNQSGVAGHPSILFFLSADAWGVLPPVARLTKEQARYYFLSGYTSKTPGTERGIVTPTETFSACFAAPFIPQSPLRYAQMLEEKLTQFSPEMYLINTGWSAGPIGVGHRIPLRITKRIVDAAFRGELLRSEYVVEDHFGLAIPLHIDGVDPAILTPSSTWTSQAEYQQVASNLRQRFDQNMKAIVHRS